MKNNLDEIEKELIKEGNKKQEVPYGIRMKMDRTYQTILYEKKNSRWQIKRKISLVIPIGAIALAVVFFSVFRVPISSAIEEFFGIRGKDVAVNIVEEAGLPVETEMRSVSNNHEIVLTRFVSTEKKMAFDYQFQMDNELRELLEHNNEIESAEKDIQSESQSVRIGLFEEGSDRDLFQGVSGTSTYRTDGDMFYGSVIGVFHGSGIPDKAKLRLHIYELEWMDSEEYKIAYTNALANDSQSFSVPPKIKYEGDWNFPIEHEPLEHKKTPTILHADNIEVLHVESDALQTTAKFKLIESDVFPIEHTEEGRPLWEVVDTPGISIYKNNVKTSGVSFDITPLGEFSLSVDLSSLDIASIYKIQVNKVDHITGEPLDELGFFEIQNIE